MVHAGFRRKKHNLPPVTPLCSNRCAAGSGLCFYFENGWLGVAVVVSQNAKT